LKVSTSGSRLSTHDTQAASFAPNTSYFRHLLSIKVSRNFGTLTAIMSATNTDPNTLFWQAYASVIAQMTKGSAPLGPNTRIYFAATNTLGIPGGERIPEEITNWGIYQLANNLLDPTDIAYNPTASNGKYVDALMFYLDNIKTVSSQLFLLVSHESLTLF
jgi:hypothetical protein